MGLPYTKKMPTWMSMVGKQVVHLFINGVYWDSNPLILTFDPKFQVDIQVESLSFNTLLLGYHA